MCSVVEIKNESEYYIYYHSPESLETVTSSAQQSLDYHHLFQLTPKTGEVIDESDVTPMQSDTDTSNINTEVNSLNQTEDKDFSVEEFVTVHQPNSVPNDDKLAEENNDGEVKDSKNDNGHDNVTDNNEFNDGNSGDKHGGQMLDKKTSDHVNGNQEKGSKG